MQPPAPILLAEDEETDVLIVRMALEQAGIANPLIVARDGQEVVKCLCGNSPYSDPLKHPKHPLPVLLILDLKMPRMTGFEVLSWLASRPDLVDVPAVVLSSSSYEEDIQRARQLGARDYFVKPHSLKDLATILQQVALRWLSVPGRQTISQE